MNNYVVIEGVRYDFKDISKITEDCCSVCALKNFCDIEDCPCSVFNACTEIYPHSPQHAFVKHVKTSNNGKEIIKNKVLTKYIDKDALVAEIERKLKNINLNYVSVGSHPSDSDTNKKLQDGISKTLQSLLSFLDTLEVKEVDLEEKENNK